jgi:glutamyl-tRNA synthetase
MTRFFDIADVNKSASALNIDKMLWTNQQHILRATPERLAKYLQPQLAVLGIVTDNWAKMAAVAKAQQERAKTLKEMAENSVFLPRRHGLTKVRKNLTVEAVPLLQAVRDRRATMWQAPSMTASGRRGGTRRRPRGRPAVRVAVSGGSVSPPIDARNIRSRDDTRLDAAIRFCRP